MAGYGGIWEIQGDMFGYRDDACAVMGELLPIFAPPGAKTNLHSETVIARAAGRGRYLDDRCAHNRLYHVRLHSS